MKSLAVAAVVLAALLAGCTTSAPRVNPNVDLATRQKFFVRSNLNDSHAVDRHIARALSRRGLTVEIGPLTMMPPDTQVVVEYDDRWVWDFGEHLVAMQITLREPKADRPFGTNQFTARMSMIRTPEGVVERMIGELLGREPTSP